MTNLHQSSQPASIRNRVLESSLENGFFQSVSILKAAPTNTKNRGFTLIELIVVIVILGTLAATAMPKFMDMRRQARIAVVKGVAGAMRSAIVIAQGAYALQKDKQHQFDTKIWDYNQTDPSNTQASAIQLQDGSLVPVFGNFINRYGAIMRPNEPQLAGMPLPYADGMLRMIGVNCPEDQFFQYYYLHHEQYNLDCSGGVDVRAQTRYQPNGADNVEEGSIQVLPKGLLPARGSPSQIRIRSQSNPAFTDHFPRCYAQYRAKILSAAGSGDVIPTAGVVEVIDDC